MGIFDGNVIGDLYKRYNELYQETFRKETLTGDLEREGSDRVYNRYEGRVLKHIIGGPAVQKLMAEKGTKDPYEIMPELYSQMVHELRSIDVKIKSRGDEVYQSDSLSKVIRVLRPLYIEEMARRIEKGPDFEEKSYWELCKEYRVSSNSLNIPDGFDMADIFEILTKRCQISFNPRPMGPEGTYRGFSIETVYSKTTRPPVETE